MNTNSPNWLALREGAVSPPAPFSLRNYYVGSVMRRVFSVVIVSNRNSVSLLFDRRVQFWSDSFVTAQLLLRRNRDGVGMVVTFFFFLFLSVVSRR